MKIVKAILLALLVVFYQSAVFAQNGNAHGINLSWQASVLASGAPTGDAIAGYNIYICLGTCTTSSGWGSSGWNKVNNSLVTGLSFFDSTVITGNTYTYASTGVDTAGNESAFSNLYIVNYIAVPNPVSPSNLTGIIK